MRQMYFYITSVVNKRHKIGITKDLTKRILNYCTLVPDISYLIACEPINAEKIEAGFKHRFKNFRPDISGGLYRRRFPLSESYEVKFKWLSLFLIHALHADSEPLVYISNKNEFLNNKDKKNKYNNKYSIELSNYYFKPNLFLNTANFDGSLVWDGHNSWFEIGYLKIKGNNIEFFYWNISKDDFKRIKKDMPNRRVGFFEKKERIKIKQQLTKGLKQKKIIFKNMGFSTAKVRAKREIFDLLCKSKIFRPYQNDYTKGKGYVRSNEYRTLKWYPFDYSITNEDKKFKISGY